MYQESDHFRKVQVSYLSQCQVIIWVNGSNKFILITLLHDNGNRSVESRGILTWFPQTRSQEIIMELSSKPNYKVIVEAVNT